MQFFLICPFHFAINGHKIVSKNFHQKISKFILLENLVETFYFLFSYIILQLNDIWEFVSNYIMIYWIFCLHSLVCRSHAFSNKIKSIMNKKSKRMINWRALTKLSIDNEIFPWQTKLFCQCSRSIFFFLYLNYFSICLNSQNFFNLILFMDWLENCNKKYQLHP